MVAHVNQPLRNIDANFASAEQTADVMVTYATYPDGTASEHVLLDHRVGCIYQAPAEAGGLPQYLPNDQLMDVLRSGVWAQVLAPKPSAEDRHEPYV